MGEARVKRAKARALSRRAFTLMELILILATLAIVTSIAAPSMSAFFRGRVLSSEARQLLALTHAARARAVSEGFPVVLWVDSDAREYGVQMENTLEAGVRGQVDLNAETFQLDPSLQIAVLDAVPLSVNGRSLPGIRFMPDGMADEDSAATIRLTSRTGEMLYLVQSTNRLGYEIRNTVGWR
ncbi:MAG TPA: GspH/FimT family pseudopilin [Verrucomicrobiota bacterium]|nr:GspH/FimT family pseudopilin [Verrucomicrobiota bacterium]HOP97603.1 GspH/FimT family pseudopilin [Verrucomicrobiota bacterium]HPU57441.1 GspH/FimT family pseudopilin [Verrucomicrobiota bacterium]